MTSHTVSVDWGLCDANGVCATEAPDVFELTDDDELAVLKTTIGAGELASVRAAARVCPKHAITIID